MAEIRFCGAARTVTGSAHLITLDDGYKILLDCGLFQGKGRNTWNLNNQWLLDPGAIDCVILSHAHIDHSGRLPKLVRDGYSGPILSTHATRSLCAIMLLDSAYIQERDVEYYNRKLIKKRKRKKQKAFREPLYTSTDVGKTMKLFQSYGYDRWIPIHRNVRLLFKDAGHILGSANVTLEIREHKRTYRLGFSGDIGRPDRPILRDPQSMPEVDFMLCESTYGDKLHQGAPEDLNAFLDIITETCVRQKGKLIIPAFSVGRTQELVYMLDKLESSGRLPGIPVYVDSPLAVNATQVYGAHPECFDHDLNAYLLVDENPFGFNKLHYIRAVEKSKALNTSTEPCIIISASGMMNAGRIRHHAYNNIEDRRNTILIVGYCSPDTPGGQLRNGAEALKIFGDWKKVNARVRVMDSFSAHADQRELLGFLRNQKSRMQQLFLVHGEIDRQKTFRDLLHSEGFQHIHIPEMGQRIRI